eukprot:gene10559-biopygen12332
MARAARACPVTGNGSAEVARAIWCVSMGRGWRARRGPSGTAEGRASRSWPFETNRDGDSRACARSKRWPFPTSTMNAEGVPTNVGPSPSDCRSRCRGSTGSQRNVAERHRNSGGPVLPVSGQS